MTRVYRNRQRHCWSVVLGRTRVQHHDTLALDDVVFRVSAAGQARCRREGVRNVHAWATSAGIPVRPRRLNGHAWSVTYHPFKADTFVDAYGRAVHAAGHAVFGRDGSVRVYRPRTGTPTPQEDRNGTVPHPRL